ncbi:hypothetical protein A2U01_0097069 [Trifolium medium]|uniref:Uncharacterized protein n=1 Tax=Trifolium medium TaxID=97028 RepID=A0A392UTY1_9FABA|nr:hypothetical protein [Trifolium medium]
MSGRCNQSYAGADSGWWLVGGPWWWVSLPLGSLFLGVYR